MSAVILVTNRLLNNNGFKRSFISDLSNLMEEYDDAVNLSFIGFPHDWKRILGEYIESE